MDEARADEGCGELLEEALVGRGEAVVDFVAWRYPFVSECGCLDGGIGGVYRWPKGCRLRMRGVASGEARCSLLDRVRIGCPSAIARRRSDGRFGCFVPVMER